jgi:hypothetical protein
MDVRKLIRFKTEAEAGRAIQDVVDPRVRISVVDSLTGPILDFWSGVKRPIESQLVEASKATS